MQSLKTFLFLFFFKLKYSLFTMLCQFLLYSKVTQSFFFFSFYGHTRSTLWARGWITAAAAGLHHSPTDPSHNFDLHHRLWQLGIFNPLSRDGTQILTETCWVLNPLSHSGNTPPFIQKEKNLPGIKLALTIMEPLNKSSNMTYPNHFSPLWLHPWHVKVPQPGIKPVPQL